MGNRERLERLRDWARNKLKQNLNELGYSYWNGYVQALSDAIQTIDWREENEYSK